MNPRILAINKLEAAQELITDTIHDLDSQPDMDDFVMVLTWARGEIAHVIIDMQKEDERMGIIWSCDRCGKMCDARENNQGWRIGKDCLDMGMRIDLCPDCVEGLRAYLRGEDL